MNITQLFPLSIEEHEISGKSKFCMRDTFGVPGCILISVSSVVEFQRWWVLKSKIFAQEFTCSKEILIPTTLNYLQSSVVCKNQSF